MNQDKWPLISIITPSYNQGQFIEETIQSVLLQDYPNIEYIIIDGGSTDNSIEVIKKYEHKISYWTSEPDNGQTDALNKGFRRANGEIIGWINSDDVFCEGAVFSAVREFIDDVNCSMVYGDIKIIDAKGKFISSQHSGNYSLEKLFIDNFIPQPGSFFKRKVFFSLGQLDESLQLAMDYDFWLRIGINHHDIKYIKKTLAKFRLYEDSKCGSRTNMFWVEKYYLLDKNLQIGILNHKIQYQAYKHLTYCLLQILIDNNKNLNENEDKIQAKEILKEICGNSSDSLNVVEEILSILDDEEFSKDDFSKIKISFSNLYDYYKKTYNMGENFSGSKISLDAWIKEGMILIINFLIENKKLLQAKNLLIYSLMNSKKIILSHVYWKNILKYYFTIIKINIG